MFQFVPIVAAVLIVSSCGNDSDGPQEASSSADLRAVALGDFPEVVGAFAGPEAENCGAVRVGESFLETNTCLAQAFSNGTGAWALFDSAPSALRGTRAELGAAHGTVTAARDVTFYAFDETDPSSTSVRSSVSVLHCMEPALSGTVDQTGPFSCERLRVVSSGDEGDESTSVASLVETEVWVWDSYRRSLDEDIEALPQGLYYSLGFAPNGSYRGLANCIGYRGTWSMDGAVVDVRPGLKDGAVCDDARTTGQIFFDALERRSHVIVEGEQLRMVPASGEGVTLIFSEGEVLYPD